VSLGGHIRQFGNDDFLLLKIECHCYLPNLDRRRASMRPTDPNLDEPLSFRARWHPATPNWWPFRNHSCKTGHPAAVCSNRPRPSRVTFAAQALHA
jgi:hypothetical protein